MTEKKEKAKKAPPRCILPSAGLEGDNQVERRGKKIFPLKIYSRIYVCTKMQCSNRTRHCYR